MAKLTRETLRQRFTTNITVASYQDLIASTFNLLDDGIDSDPDNGLKITSRGPSKRLMTFCETLDRPLWYLSVNADNKQGLSLNDASGTRLFVQQARPDGEGGTIRNVGVGTDDPRFPLEVKGVVGAHGRAGTFARGYVQADGKWHTVLEDLAGCHGFEVMAQIVDDADQRFALTYAVMLLSAGKRGTRQQVFATRAANAWFWGRFWNQIAVRWQRADKSRDGGSPDRFDLQIRTRTFYGVSQAKPMQLYYRIGKLWDRNYESETYTAAPIQPVQQTYTPPVQPQPQQPQPPRPVQEPVRPQQPPVGGGGIKITPKS
ncbi:MAG: hypothetical protein SF053_16030 [Bacteroidia bacterium]|nr:hypothetical protein [Bacteroidia bacterium]